MAKKMAGWAVFLIILLLLAVLAFIGWTLWSRRRAAQLGLPPPSWNPFKRSSPNPSYPTPRAGGIAGWVSDKIRAFKNRRYASGAYEEGRGDGTRGPGHRLEPDEAWDARVGNEAYYEEQELGLHAPTAYGGSGYGHPAPPASSGVPPSPHAHDVPEERERGRSRTREFDNVPYNPDQVGTDRARTPASAQNPFGDNAEPSNISLRGVSPRPLDTAAAAKHSGKSAENSPTERRSMFRENM